MLSILINCSNLKKGGGLQVADSICNDLCRFCNFHFVVVLSSNLKKTGRTIENYPNCTVEYYDSNNGWYVLLTGRDLFLDKLVFNYKIDAVLSVFGPISWVPRCPHLCGFARPHIVLSDSPYFKRMPFTTRMRNYFLNHILTYFFCRGVSAFFTESHYISEKWRIKTGKKPVYTVTNYYNQVFDHSELWKVHTLPLFTGKTLLCISGYYPHKNLEIAIDIAKILKKKHPDFQFRFVFTIEPDQYPKLDSDFENNFCFIGKVHVSEAPSLYEQADIMFQPSLLECFSATYPEAMRMNVPIVAADMEFARSLCGDAAVYYAPLDAVDAADTIYRVATDKELREILQDKGKKQLRKYDTYEQRTNKLMEIIENKLGK